MNGWNDFEYNFAAGAGTCGMCYWLVPGANSGMSRMEHWTGYASSQIDFNQLKGAAKTPLQRFVGNSPASAQYSFITVASFASCYGVVTNSDSQTSIPAVPNPLAAAKGDLSYYPSVDASKGRQATKCPDDQSQDCSSVPRCDYGMVGNVDQEAGCTVTTIDHYTTSFNWAQTNVSAMWLRPQWYVVSNSAVTDVQNGGLTFVSGGGYSYSDEIPRYWALAYRDAFVGRTQPTNNFASDAGPFNGFTIKDLKCDPLKDGTHNGTFCLSAADGVAFPLNGFAVNQRFFNIYDGPS